MTLPALTTAVAATHHEYHDFPSYVARLVALDRAIYFDACEGNNGDDLITVGAQSVFRLTGARLVASPDLADAIIINGGGMFVEGYQQGMGKVRYYSETYPDKPLCIGPQSFHLSSDTLRTIVTARRAPFVVCVRETPSLQNLQTLLKDLPQVELLFDHDLALRIDAAHPVLQRPLRARHILIVERQDREHRSHRSVVAASAPVAPHRRLLQRLLPAFVRNELKRIRLRRSSARETPFRRWVENQIRTQHPELATLPRITADISRKDVTTFEGFVSTIADSALVFTDRLHVGILASRLEKRTYLFEGNYHKCRGIYERSLKPHAHVTLVTAAEAGI